MSQQEILDSKKYFQEFFPQVFNQSPFAQIIDLNIGLCFSLVGPGGGEWTLRFVQGKLMEMLPQGTSGAEICYTMDTATFFQIVSAQLNPQQAFFQGKIKLEGDTFRALKMATILTDFFSAYPYESAKKLTLDHEAKELPIVEERVYFESEDKDDKVEGVLSYREEARNPTGILIIPPHPCLGGNMDNNVILCLAQSLALEGYVTIRFNYRGVGANQVAVLTGQEELGIFCGESLSSSDTQKLADVLAGISFLAKLVSQLQPSTSVPMGNRGQKIVVIGYSFGAYLAALATQQSSLVQALVMVAPPVAFHGFDSIKYPQIPKLIIGSDNDFAYPIETLQKLYVSLKGTKNLVLLSGKDHFFVGQEKEIASLTHDFLAKVVYRQRET